MEPLSMYSESPFAGTWQRKVPQGIAFLVTFIQALTHVIPSIMILYVSMFLLMAFDSIETSADLATRRQWMETWLMVAFFGTILCVPLHTTAAGVVLGLIWLRGRVDEAQKQARRVARLSFPLLILSAGGAAVCLIITLIDMRWETLSSLAWFAAAAACSLSLFSHAQMHSPPPAEETRGMLLTALLLLGSLYQIWITPLLSGETYSYPDGQRPGAPDPPAALVVLGVIHRTFVIVFMLVALTCGVLGVVVAEKTFFSNRDRPETKQLQLHARLITLLMVGSGPVPVVFDALYFLLTPSLGLGSLRNGWSILQQPLICVLLLLGMLWINRQVGKVWSKSELAPAENGADTALLAAVSTEV